MILKGDFFIVSSMQAEGNSVMAMLELNPSHAIFEGHFPGSPVVPGVCMMQMVKELLEDFTGKETMLTKADMMKFLLVINPVVNRLIGLQLKYELSSEGVYAVNASIVVEGKVSFKFKGEFTVL